MSDLSTTVPLNYFVIIRNPDRLLHPEAKLLFTPPEFEQWLAHSGGWSLSLTQLVKDYDKETGLRSPLDFGHYDVAITYDTVADAVFHKLRWSDIDIRFYEKYPRHC